MLDMKQLMEEHFVHYDDVKPSTFTSMKVEDDDIFDPFEIFKEEVQPTLDLSITSNNMIEFVQQDEVEETLVMIDMLMSILIKDKKFILKEDLTCNT